MKLGRAGDDEKVQSSANLRQRFPRPRSRNPPRTAAPRSRGSGRRNLWWSQTPARRRSRSRGRSGPPTSDQAAVERGEQLGGGADAVPTTGVPLASLGGRHPEPLVGARRQHGEVGGRYQSARRSSSATRPTKRTRSATRSSAASRGRSPASEPVPATTSVTSSRPSRGSARSRRSMPIRGSSRRTVNRTGPSASSPRRVRGSLPPSPGEKRSVSTSPGTVVILRLSSSSWSARSLAAEVAEDENLLAAATAWRSSRPRGGAST